MFEHLVLDLAIDVSQRVLDVERVAITATLGSHDHLSSRVLESLELSGAVLEPEMPELLLLETLRVGVEDLEQVAALLDLAVSVRVDDLSEILHESEVRPHLICQASHLAELWNQSDFCAGSPVLVNQKRLVGLLDFLVISGLVVLFVRDLNEKRV